MNMIYNSEQYSVVEFGVDHNLEALRFGGYEIVDKSGRRESTTGWRAICPRGRADRARACIAWSGARNGGTRSRRPG